jgi:hypothetical protein
MSLAVYLGRPLGVAVLILLGSCTDTASSPKTDLSRGRGLAAYFDKLESCGIGRAGEVGKGPSADKQEDCDFGCMAKVSCEALDALLCERTREPPLELTECQGACRRANAFACADGRLLEPWQVCNAQKECVGGEDEAGCVGYADFEQQFYCGDQSLIAAEAVCDGQASCADESDEQSCDELKPKCADGSLQISPSHVCDGRDDCDDGSDETSCGWGTFTCDEGKVVGGHKRCDRDMDCMDGSDEQGCATLACPGMD